MAAAAGAPAAEISIGVAATILGLASAILIATTRPTAIDDQPPQNFYHGTSAQSGLALLNGVPLSAAEALTNKIDGPPGFYMATNPVDAEYFSYRRTPGTIVQFSMANSAMSTG